MANAVTTFFYVNPDGSPFARKDRKELGGDKKFTQYLWNESAGKYEPGLNGAKLPLYHADELAASPNAQPRYIVEGEKKCDALRNAFRQAGVGGAVVTTNGSASSKLTNEQIEQLKGAPSIIFIVDADVYGRRQGYRVAQQIADVSPECVVKIIDLYPERTGDKETEGKPLDIADWLAEGHTIAELVALIEAAPRFQATTVARHREPPTFTRVGDILADKDAEIEYVVGGLIPRGGTAILAGRPKSGKSLTAADMALAIVRGDNFLDRKTRKGPAFYLALEGAKTGWKNTLNRMGIRQDEDLFFCFDRPPEKAIEWLADAIEKHGPGLVVVDTMQRFLRVKDSNAYSDASNVLDGLIELARQTNTSVLLVTHSGKVRNEDIVGEVIGSTAWAGGVDTIMVLRRTERFRTLSSEQRFGENLPETVLALNPSTWRIESSGSKTAADRKMLGKAVVDFLEEYAEDHPEEPYADEHTILEEVEGRKSDKQDAIREGVQLGQVERIGAGKKGNPYLYSTSGPRLKNGRQNPKDSNSPYNAEEITTSHISHSSSKNEENGRQNGRKKFSLFGEQDSTSQTKVLEGGRNLISSERRSSTGESSGSTSSYSEPAGADWRSEDGQIYNSDSQPVHITPFGSVSSGVTPDSADPTVGPIALEVFAEQPSSDDNFVPKTLTTTNSSPREPSTTPNVRASNNPNAPIRPSSLFAKEEETV